MALPPINIGSAPDDGTGEAHRSAFDKVNDFYSNFLLFESDTDSELVQIQTDVAAAQDDITVQASSILTLESEVGIDDFIVDLNTDDSFDVDLNTDNSFDEDLNDTGGFASSIARLQADVSFTVGETTKTASSLLTLESYVNDDLAIAVAGLEADVYDGSTGLSATASLALSAQTDADGNASSIAALESHTSIGSGSSTASLTLRTDIDDEVSARVTLEAEVDDNTSAVSTLELTVDGLEAEAVLKVDSNGRIASVSLNADADTGTEISIVTDDFLLTAAGLRIDNSEGITFLYPDDPLQVIPSAVRLVWGLNSDPISEYAVVFGGENDTSYGSKNFASLDNDGLHLYAVTGPVFLWSGDDNIYSLNSHNFQFGATFEGDMIATALAGSQPAQANQIWRDSIDAGDDVLRITSP